MALRLQQLIEAGQEDMLSAGGACLRKPYETWLGPGALRAGRWERRAFRSSMEMSPHKISGGGWKTRGGCHVWKA